MPHSKSKFSGPNQIHLAGTCQIFGGDAPDGKTNKHLATSDRHRGGGTHLTERLANIDMVGGWARQTQRGDALDGKTNKQAFLT